MPYDPDDFPRMRRVHESEREYLARVAALGIEPQMSYDQSFSHRCAELEEHRNPRPPQRPFPPGPWQVVPSKGRAVIRARLHFPSVVWPGVEIEVDGAARPIVPIAEFCVDDVKGLGLVERLVRAALLDEGWLRMALDVPMSVFGSPGASPGAPARSSAYDLARQSTPPEGKGDLE